MLKNIADAFEPFRKEFERHERAKQFNRLLSWVFAAVILIAGFVAVAVF